jgi:hypothetical protein
LVIFYDCSKITKIKKPIIDTKAYELKGYRQMAVGIAQSAGKEDDLEM